jgi:hypothetical protein
MVKLCFSRKFLWRKTCSSENSWTALRLNRNLRVKEQPVNCLVCGTANHDNVHYAGCDIENLVSTFNRQGQRDRFLALKSFKFMFPQQTKSTNL